MTALLRKILSAPQAARRSTRHLELKVHDVRQFLSVVLEQLNGLLQRLEHGVCGLLPLLHRHDVAYRLTDTWSRRRFKKIIKSAKKNFKVFDSIVFFSIVTFSAFVCIYFNKVYGQLKFKTRWNVVRPPKG